MTRTQDLAADYIDACKAARRADATLAEQHEARELAAKIALQAYNLGSPLDEVALDEQARRELYPTRPVKPRIIDYNVVGLPIYG